MELYPVPTMSLALTHSLTILLKLSHPSSLLWVSDSKSIPQPFKQTKYHRPSAIPNILLLPSRLYLLHLMLCSKKSGTILSALNSVACQEMLKQNNVLNEGSASRATCKNPCVPQRLYILSGSLKNRHYFSNVWRHLQYS